MPIDCSSIIPHTRSTYTTSRLQTSRKPHAVCTLLLNSHRAEYCCAGAGKCKIPVPKPLSFEELPALRRSATAAAAAAVERDWIPMDISAGTLQLPPNADVPAGRSAANPANLCTDDAMQRKAAAAGTPKADGQGKVLVFTTFNWPPANAAPGACTVNSPCGKATCSYTGSCSGNTLSNGLVLMAAHCIDPWDYRWAIRKRAMCKQCICDSWDFD